MIQVTKASGELEPLSLDKVRASLSRAGAQTETIDKVLLELKPKLYDKIPTREIYSQVFKLLDTYQPRQAERYTLKSALFNLGPSGHPFEEFIARLFTAMGYQTKTQVIIAGQCVSHEIDVVVQKGKDIDLIECKFHQRAGAKCDIKTALYVQARFEDIAQKYPGVYRQIWLVNNTKLTTQAIRYGRCKNMGLLAWHYPENEGIEKLIDKFNLYHLLKLGYSEK